MKHKEDEDGQTEKELQEGYELIPEAAPKEFETGPWTDPKNIQYGCGK